MKALLLAALLAGAVSAGCFRNVGHYTASDGSTIYVGEFYNDQPGPGYGPAEIKGYLYDASGNLIDTAGGFLCLGVDPKGVVPFKAWTFTAPEKVARIEWTIVDPPATPYLATGLEAKVTNTFAVDGKTYVVGEVTNTSKNVYVATIVCASWTDGDGRVVREAWNNGGAWRVNPGDKVPFSLPVDTPPAGANVHFYLDGIVTVPGEVPSTAVDIPRNALRHNFQTTNGNGRSYVTTGMGEVANTGTSHFRPDAVATIYDATGKLLATRGDPSDCTVNAPPGGFTYMTYKVIAGATTPAAPGVVLQGFQFNNGPVYFPKVSNLRHTVDAVAHTITVTGTLTNTSTAALAFANVCAGAYDSAGVVRSVGQASLELQSAALAAGASAPFTITLSDPGGVTRVNAVADGFGP